MILKKEAIAAAETKASGLGPTRRSAAQRVGQRADRNRAPGPRVCAASRSQQRAFPAAAPRGRGEPRSVPGRRARHSERAQLRRRVFLLSRGRAGAGGPHRPRRERAGRRRPRAADPGARELRRALPGGHVRGRARRGFLGQRRRAQGNARFLQPPRARDPQLGRQGEGHLRRRLPAARRARARGRGGPREPGPGRERLDGRNSGAGRGAFGVGSPPTDSPAATASAPRRSAPDWDVPDTLAPFFAAVAQRVPIPFRGAGPGALPRVHAEIGPYAALVAGGALAGSGGSYDGLDTGGQLIDTLSLGLRVGAGPGGAPDRQRRRLDLPGGRGGHELPRGHRLPGVRGRPGQPAPARAGPVRDSTARMRAPFWLIPGDLILAAPILNLIDPEKFTRWRRLRRAAAWCPGSGGSTRRSARFQVHAGPRGRRHVLRLHRRPRRVRHAGCVLPAGDRGVPVGPASRSRSSNTRRSAPTARGRP